MYRLIGATEQEHLRLYDELTGKVRTATRREAGKLDILPTAELSTLMNTRGKKYYVLHVLPDSYVLVDKTGKIKRVTPDSCKDIIDDISNMYLYEGKPTFYDKSRVDEASFVIKGDTVVEYLGSAETLRIPSYVRKIADGVFQGVTAKYAKLVSVKEIGKRAFADCPNLVVVDCNDNLVKVDEGAFEGCKYLNFVRGVARLRTVDKQAFRGCINLQYFPFNLITSDLTIGDEAFTGTQLLSIKLAEGVGIQVGKRAFKGCPFIKDIDLSGSATIKDFAFSECVGLESLSLQGVGNIGKGAFADTARLLNVKLNDTVEVHRFAFEDSAFEQKAQGA